MGFGVDVDWDQSVDEGAQAPGSPRRRWWWSPLVWGALCWMTGITLGRAADHVTLWITLAITAAIAGGVLQLMSDWGWTERRTMVLRGAAITGWCAAIVAAGAGWWGLRCGGEAVWGLMPPGLGASELVSVEGEVAERPTVWLKEPGLMGKFEFRGPRSSLLVRVDRVRGEAGWRGARAAVVVEEPGDDRRWRAGDRVRVTGWLSGIAGPGNPGEPDRRAMLGWRGVVGRVSVDNPANVTLIAARDGSAWSRFHESLASGARWSLRGSLPMAQRDGPTEAMIEAMLLGDRSGDLGEVDQAFRRTGLAHLLAVAGLHLGILVAGAWWVALLLTGRPGLAVGVGLGVIGVYLAVVPVGVPIVRAAVTMGIACWSLGMGKRVAGMAALSGAAMVLLAWRPFDLFGAGFELSFGVVAGLILFTPRMSWRLMKRDTVERNDFWGAVKRWGAEYVAVTVVAWAVAGPIVAKEFGVVSVWGPVVSLVVMPAAAVMLWAGFAKVVLGALVPGVGGWVEPMVWSGAKSTAGMAQWAAKLPGAWFEVSRPGWLWVVVTLWAIGAVLGRSRGWRRRAAWGLVACCVAVLMVPMPGESVAGLRVNMFAVGAGSCYLLRSGGEAMVFDCGSSQRPDITTAAIGPALRSMGVSRIGRLMISHPDTDHFSGALELVDGFGVKEVLLTQAFRDEAASHPGSAPRFLLDELSRRGVRITTVARGWCGTLGEAKLETLWPDPQRSYAHSNDSSIVMRVSVCGRRVLLCGDAAKGALGPLLAEHADVRADVLEMPHHGSMIAESPAWLAAVHPAITLQSAGWDRLRRDPWAGRLVGVDRHVTPRTGMVEVHINRRGELHVTDFRH